MKLLHATQWPGRKYRLHHGPIADNAGGFVCILDLSRRHKDPPRISIGQLFALIALIASAAFVADWLFSIQPDCPQQSSGSAGQDSKAESIISTATESPNSESQN